MTITLNGTTGITTPAVTNNGAYTGDGISFADATPSNTLVTSTGGNVGIGTSSPSNKFVVSNAGAAGVEVNPTTGNIFTFNRNTSVYTDMVLTANNAIFQTGGTTERMRIDSSGNLLVGTTSVPSGAGSGSGRITATTLNLTDGIRSHQGSGGAFGGNAFNFYWTGSAQLWVDSTNIGNIATSSDYRIKRNIETQTESGIEKVLKLRPVTYQMADYGTMFKASDDIKEGFIAHEVQEVIPSGAEGVKDEEHRIQNLKLDAILSVAVKAIQELKAELDTVKAEVTALKGTA